MTEKIYNNSIVPENLGIALLFLSKISLFH